MQVSFYGHVRQYHNVKKAIDRNIHEVLESGQYVLGPMLKKFEGEFATYAGTKHAVGCNSGTDALWLVFLSLGIGPGDECITTTNTFFATAEAIWFTGATAVFVDSDPKTQCLDPERIEAAITSRTKCIVPVHLYGQCADMKAIAALAKKHNLFVVEDNAQAIDASGKGFKQGEYSNAVCTSFIIQKNLGTFGDGGAVLTNDDSIDRTCRRLRNHGSPARSRHSMGYNSRLDDLHAGILLAKLPHLGKWSDQRIKLAARYSQKLAGLKNIELPHVRPGYRHVFHLYVIHTRRPEQRDELLKFLNDNGVDAKCHYPIAIHQQEGYPWGKNARIVGGVQNSERNAACCVSLPLFPELTAKEVDCAARKVIEWDRKHA